MFHKISEQIIAYATKNKILDSSNADEYIYGLEITLSVLTSYVSIIVIGFLMGMLWQSVLFLFIYVSVRRFSGGFHFNSQLICYLSMCIMCPIVLLIIEYTENSVVPLSIIMTVSIIILLIVSPVPAIEKPLDEKEQTVYYKILRIIVIAISAVYIILCLFEQIYIAKIIATTISAAAIFAILGKIKYVLHKKITGAVS